MNGKVLVSRAGSPGPRVRSARRGPVPSRWPRAIALSAVACCALSACGGGGPAGAQGRGSRATATYAVRTAKVRGLGTILVDRAGATLYAYVPDHQGPSRCTRACASEWPPLLVPSGVRRPRAGPGADPARLGTTRRAGGARQVTYGRWPLYLYENDHGPGSVDGQGDDMGLWYVVSPSGKLDRRAAPAGP